MALKKRTRYKRVLNIKKYTNIFCYISVTKPLPQHSGHNVIKETLFKIHRNLVELKIYVGNKMTKMQMQCEPL